MWPGSATKLMSLSTGPVSRDSLRATISREASEMSSARG